jgi:hypothetical protein
MKSMDRVQVQTSSGWMDIGNRLVTITGGSGGAGTVLHMKGHTGVIRITTTIAKAGECTRDIGTMRITTMAIGETMIMIVTIMIATIMITTTTDPALWGSEWIVGKPEVIALIGVCRNNIQFARDLPTITSQSATVTPGASLSGARRVTSGIVPTAFQKIESKEACGKMRSKVSSNLGWALQLR